MPGNNKKENKSESFETARNSNFISIYWDMFDSKAWKELNPFDIALYLNFKRKYHRKKSNGMIYDSNKGNITFPQHTYGDKPDQLGYEEIMNERTFRKSIDHLIETGFIHVVQNRWTTRQATIYGFSDMWKKYGTPEFKITDKDRRDKSSLSKEHKKAISDAVKKNNSKRVKSKVILINNK